MINRYIAAITMPVPATAAYHGPSVMPDAPGWPWAVHAASDWNAEIRQSTSDGKPFSPGRPTDAIAKNTMNEAQTGILEASPDTLRMSRVWYRSYMNPIMRNRPPVEKPWLSMYRTEPDSPVAFNAVRPSTQKPRWLTDEYATSFLMSSCTQQISPA